MLKVLDAHPRILCYMLPKHEVGMILWCRSDF